jgi:hypothetical protein
MSKARDRQALQTAAHNDLARSLARAERVQRDAQAVLDRAHALIAEARRLRAEGASPPPENPDQPVRSTDGQ